MASHVHQLPLRPGIAPSSAKALMIPAPPPNVRPAGTRLVFSIDATVSRSTAWDAAKKLTDSMFAAVPKSLEVALAVHGGSAVHTFTPFERNPENIRHAARKISCEAGGTQLIPILRESYTRGGVGTIIYIGDTFEENADEALAVGSVLGRSGTRIIILYDAPKYQFDKEEQDRSFFGRLAHVSNGAVLHFDASALDQLRALLGAIAVLTAHGIEHVKANQQKIAGATLLLQHLKG